MASSSSFVFSALLISLALAFVSYSHLFSPPHRLHSTHLALGPQTWLDAWIPLMGWKENQVPHPLRIRNQTPALGFPSRKRSLARRCLSLVLASDGSISPEVLAGASSFELEDGIVEELAPRIQEQTRAAGRPPEQSTFGYLPCPPSMRDFISCQESFSGERKPCDADKDNRCIVTVPSTYVRPFRWPQCQNQIRAHNVPLVPLLRSKNAHNWLKIRGDIIRFLPTAPGFTASADRYIEHLSKLVPSLEFGKQTRLVLDIGGGTGSLSAALEKRGVLTMTITDRESAENGIQLVLERGLPGLVQTLRTHRLPYPDQAFDLLHCADCSIPWLDNGGLLLLEADRLVRAGGFVIFMNTSSNEQYQTGIVRLTSAICWELVRIQANLIIWQKSSNKTCHSLHPAVNRDACDNSSRNLVWNVSLTHCLVDATEQIEAIVKIWPLRLTAPPIRLQYVPTASIQTAKEEAYVADLNYWKYLTSFYLLSFGISRTKDIRNVIDMNAGYGSFIFGEYI